MNEGQYNIGRMSQTRAQTPLSLYDARKHTHRGSSSRNDDGSDIMCYKMLQDIVVYDVLQPLC